MDHGADHGEVASIASINSLSSVNCEWLLESPSPAGQTVQCMDEGTLKTPIP
jgi:hypothetical protein